MGDERRILTALVGAATKVTGMPCCTVHGLMLQFMAFSGKRSPAFFNGRLACDKDGKIIAGEFDSGLDNGAYPETGRRQADEDTQIHVLPLLCS